MKKIKLNIICLENFIYCLSNEEPKEKDFVLTPDEEIFYIHEIAHAGLIRNGKGLTSVLDGSKKILYTNNNCLGIKEIPEDILNKFINQKINEFRL